MFVTDSLLWALQFVCISHCVLIDTEEYECMRDILLTKGMCLQSSDLLQFRKMSDNISETVQDRDLVAMEH